MSLQEIQSNLTNELEKMVARANVALLAQGREILDASNLLVPVRTGALQQSGTVTQSDSGKVTISYTAPYALEVHEDTQKSHPHGQSKFLETALMTKRADILPNIAKDIKQ